MNAERIVAVLLSTFLAVSIAGGVAFGPVAAEHPDSPDYTEQANFTVAAVSQSDHYPGQDAGSMRYWAAGESAFVDQGAEEGIWLEYVIIDADWIDYRDCNVENTASFGIDRGNDNRGTNYDQDLVQHQKQATFRDDGLTVEFYDHADFGGDPPYMAPEDAIVAQQGEGSTAGGCLSVTDEPGWYRIEGYASGTVADNGDSTPPSDGADEIEVSMKSTWFYVCECESEADAREQLGAPPGETAGGDPGGSADGGADEPSSDSDGATPAASTPEPTASEPASATDEPSADGATPARTASADEPAASTPAGTEAAAVTATEAGSGPPAGQDEPGADPAADDPASTAEAPADREPGTPQVTGDGPGFGPVVAVLALLGSGLWLSRRR